MPNDAPEPGKKWLIAIIVFVALFCAAFALYLIVAGFYWRPLPNP
ncbi:MAG: hypothetical protein ABIP75_10285 [Pyrinomonadaceae bacterium]